MDFDKSITLLINTIQKEYRNRSLIFLLLFTGLLIFMINGAVDFIADNRGLSFNGKMTVLYLIIGGWNCFIAGLLGAGCIQSDQENNVILQLLAFPIRRSEYLLSRILGTWLIVVAYYGISLAMGFAAFSVSSGTAVIKGNIIISLFISSLAILATVMLAVFFSLFMPRLAAFLSTVFAWIFIELANHSLAEVPLKEIFSNLDLSGLAALFLHFGLPRIGTVNSISRAVFMDRDCNLNLWLEGLHFGLTSSLLFAVILLIFRTKE